MAWDAVVKARPYPAGGEVQLQTWAEAFPWQVRQARGLALATPYPKEAKEALLEEALLQVLELRLQVLWPLKLALGAPVAEPTLELWSFCRRWGRYCGRWASNFCRHRTRSPLGILTMQWYV